MLRKTNVQSEVGDLADDRLLHARQELPEHLRSESGGVVRVRRLPVSHLQDKAGGSYVRKDREQAVEAGPLVIQAYDIQSADGALQREHVDAGDVRVDVLQLLPLLEVEPVVIANPLHRQSRSLRKAKVASLQLECVKCADVGECVCDGLALEDAAAGQ